MKQAFFLVSALFVLFQLGENVTAASIEVSSENTEADQQTQLKNAEDEINRIVNSLVDLLNKYFDSFQIKFDEAHQIVSEIIQVVANVPDDAPEKVKTVLESFTSTFSSGHERLMALIDQYQEQGVQRLVTLKEGITETMNTIMSTINAAKESSKSSTA